MILRARKDTSEVKIKPFVGADYHATISRKVQKMTDKSVLRVQELQKQIEAAEAPKLPREPRMKLPHPLHLLRSLVASRLPARP